MLNQTLHSISIDEILQYKAFADVFYQEIRQKDGQFYIVCKITIGNQVVMTLFSTEYSERLDLTEKPHK